MSRIHGSRQIMEATITSDRFNGSLDPAHGGTGVDNGTNTLTIGGNVSFAPVSGASISFTASTSGDLSFTLPASGTLVNQSYVDAVVSGLDPKLSCRCAMTDVLPAYTYLNNVITGSANGAIPSASCDGITLQAGNRVLVWKETETNLPYNGIYVVTQVGDASNPFILTRATDADNTPTNEVNGGMFTFIEQGSLYQGNGFVLVLDGQATLGTTGLVFTLFSGAASVAVGGGLEKQFIEGVETIIISNTTVVPASGYNKFNVNSRGQITGASAETTLAGLGLVVPLSALDWSPASGVGNVSLEELNALADAGCTNEDFVKLHSIAVSDITLDSLVTFPALASTSGSAYVGVNATVTGIVGASTVEQALATVQDSLESLSGTHEANMAALAAVSGSSLVGVDANITGIVGASTVEQALTTLQDSLESLSGTHEADMAALAAVSGSSMVGVDATITGIVGASTVEQALTTLQDTIESLDDTQGSSMAALASVSGASLVGVNESITGIAGASTVEEALTALQTTFNNLNATAVAFTPVSGSNLTSTDVAAALLELQGDIDAINLATSNIVDYKDLTAQAIGGVTVFSVGEAYTPRSLRVWDNGLLLRLGADQDYTESNPAAGQFTLVEAPVSGTEIIVSYR